MTMKLQEPGDWLREQLEKLHMSQNEVARKAGIASSTMSYFAAGNAGEGACVLIANFFNVPTQLTLAMCGFTSPPASHASVEAESLALVYNALGEDKRKQLIDYARFLTG